MWENSKEISRHSCVKIEKNVKRRPIRLPKKVLVSRPSDTSSEVTLISASAHSLSSSPGTTLSALLKSGCFKGDESNNFVQKSEFTTFIGDGISSKCNFDFDASKVEQHFVNGFYSDTSESITNKKSLETILERTEMCTSMTNSSAETILSEIRIIGSENLQKSYYEQIKESSSEHLQKSFEEPLITTSNETKNSNSEKIRLLVHDLTSFRDKYFFECHSFEDKLNSELKILNEPNHYCTHLFYLNERLFPVPVVNDSENRIRCNECYLPFDQAGANYFNKKKIKDLTSKNTKATSTSSLLPRSVISGVSIKRKQYMTKRTSTSDLTKIGPHELQGIIKLKTKNLDVVEDVYLLVPIKDNLIVTERRTKDEDLKIGCIQINTYKYPKKIKKPDNSLALRFQKGYTELIPT